jgi:hypothetical protein
MADGWKSHRAIQDQIDDSVTYAVAGARADPGKAAHDAF